jgi:AAA ATPase domain
VVEPVGVFDLEGAGTFRTRLDRSRARGLSAFVGRDRDMTLLEAALERAGDGGQVLGIMAEAGTGKSRLCAEFLDHCRAQGFPVLEGRGVAHGEARRRTSAQLPGLEGDSRGHRKSVRTRLSAGGNRIRTIGPA